MKKYCLYSLDLTTKNNLTSGFMKRHEDVTLEDLRQALKNGLESLRRKARTRQWSYIIYCAISNVHQSQGGRLGSWHVHALAYGSPCFSIMQELKGYWTRHHYGNPIQCKQQRCYSGGKVRYVRMQEVAGLFQKVNATPILEGLNLEHNASKSVILNAWMNELDTVKNDTIKDIPCLDSIALDEIEF